MHKPTSTMAKAALAAAVALATPLVPVPAGAGATAPVRVSVAADGSEANSHSQDPVLSADGRFMAFVSGASNLVADDTNGRSWDIFVRDAQTGAITRVSVASDGTEADAGSLGAAISTDARYVAFSSLASNLVPGDTNAKSDVFVHDRATATTTRVSVASDGTEGNDVSSSPAISGDGRFVAFSSKASNLVFPDTNLIDDVFVHDRQSGTTTRVSVSSPAELVGPAQGNGSSAGHPSLSHDGSHVAFSSLASNLVAGDTNGRRDVFVHDRTSGATTRVSVASDASQANNDSSAPTLSADERLVVFLSNASDLVASDSNAVGDVFLHDRTSGATTRVSVADGGGEANGASFDPVITADGRLVVFSSGASNLVPGDTAGRQDVFFHDRSTAATTRLNVAADGAEDNRGVLGRSAMSADGRRVIFGSIGTNLVAGDTNASSDLFAVDVSVPEAVQVSVGDVAVHEGDRGARAATFTVSLSEPAASTVAVDYATSMGTAGAGDFTAVSGTLSIAAGSTSATVKVPVAPDTDDEGDESFTLALSSPTGAAIADGTGTGTILDDDPPATTGRRVAIGDVAVHEGDVGTRVAVFNVSLSKPSTSYVSVSFATAKGTAIGTDFVAKSGTLRFAPGATSLNVKVAITPDGTAEGDESFNVKLSGASGATVADATGVGTIVDDD